MAALLKQKEEEVKEISTLEEVLLKKDIDKKNPDDELIEVIVTNLEQPFLAFDIGFGPTKDFYKRHFFHGERCVLSRKVARFIESRKIPQYNYVPDGTGKQKKTLTGYKQRFSCRQVF